MKKTISVFLAVFLIFSVFTGCSFGKNKNINMAKVTFPVPTDAETIVNITTGLALNYYMSGRAYLDKFLNFDTEVLNEQNYDDYKTLLANSLSAFENAGKVNDVLVEALDIWEKAPKTNEEPGYEEFASASTFGYGMTAYAAAEQGSKQWAKEILDQWSQRTKEYGGLRRISDYLGKDTKYAYSALQQAQEILDGEEYQALAKKENSAFQTASVLKTTGTAAGLVIAVATAPVSGALATAVSTGGITVSGINTVLEVGSTGAILYTNGEDNEITTFCDSTEAQLAPVGQIFSIAGLGSSLKDIGKTGADALKNGLGSLDEKTKADLLTNSFGVISYGTSSLNDYMNDGSILSGTLKHTDKGLEFTLMDTLTGTEPEKQENVKEMLTKAGIDKKKVEDAISTASNAENEPVKFQTNRIPDEIADNIIEQTTDELPNDFDIDAYLEKLRGVLYEIAAMEHEDEEPEATEEPEAEEGLSLSRVVGNYSVSGTDSWEDFEDEQYNGTDSFSGTVTFSAAGENAITMSGNGVTYGPSNYDSTIATCSFTDEDGIAVFVTFTENDDGISVHMSYNQSFEGGRSYGSYTGRKQ